MKHTIFISAAVISDEEIIYMNNLVLRSIYNVRQPMGLLMMITVCVRKLENNKRKNMKIDHAFQFYVIK